jgi:hypothetical protein
MYGFHSLPRRRSTLAGLALVACLVLAGCGSNGEASGQAADAAIGIQTSQLGVTIENRAGAALTDVKIDIAASGMTFSTLVPRIESAQRLPLPPDDFTSPDGTHFNLRGARPSSVRVTATDVTGQAHDVEVEWR